MVHFSTYCKGHNSQAASSQEISSLRVNTGSSALSPFSQKGKLGLTHEYHIAHIDPEEIAVLVAAAAKQ